MWPLEVWCLQKWPPQHCLWPHFFIAESFFYSKNGDVCKKLELNVLRFDRDMRVSISSLEKKKINFWFPCERKHRKSSYYHNDWFVLGWHQRKDGWCCLPSYCCKNKRYGMDISVDIVGKNSKHSLSYSVTSSLNIQAFEERGKNIFDMISQDFSTCNVIYWINHVYEIELLTLITKGNS